MDTFVWIRPIPENALKILQVLKDFGFGSTKITIDDLLKQDSIIQLGYEPVRIDIINSVSGLEFESSWNEKIDEYIDGIFDYSLSLQNFCKICTGE